MSAEWLGYTQSRTVRKEYAKARDALAHAAKSFQWGKVFELISDGIVDANSWRLDGRSFFTPLHQAAYGNAPVNVVEKLIASGAWRALQNSKGERPVDIAEQKGHMRLVKLLKPDYKRIVPLSTLMNIQRFFHLVIRHRVEKIVEKEELRLPELVILLELDEPNMWFPVPGMYGGFSFWLEDIGPNVKLISESWCRIAGGSGQRHVITSSGHKLVDEGFV